MNTGSFLLAASPCRQREERTPRPSRRAPVLLPSSGGSFVASPCQRPLGPLAFHFQDPTPPWYHKGKAVPHTPVGILPLEVVVQGIVLGIQQAWGAGQELMAAADRFEFQNEEAQAEHGSHLLQFPGTKLETLPVQQSSRQWLYWADTRSRWEEGVWDTSLPQILRSIQRVSLCALWTGGGQSAFHQIQGFLGTPLSGRGTEGRRPGKRPRSHRPHQ